MKKDFAVFNKVGIPQYVCHLSLESEARGLPVTDEHGNTRVDIPNGLSDEQILEECVYDFKGKTLVNIGKKPSEDYVLDIKNLKWVFGLDGAKKRKSNALNASCAAAITEGFESMALGYLFTYPCRQIDQHNLSGSVMSSFLEDDDSWTTPFWCASEDGVWDMRPHTAEQIKQVGRDCKRHVVECQLKNAQLQAQIQAATTEEELNSIAW
jgi:hypothetical protein